MAHSADCFPEKSPVFFFKRFLFVWLSFINYEIMVGGYMQRAATWHWYLVLCNHIISLIFIVLYILFDPHENVSLCKDQSWAGRLVGWVYGMANTLTMLFLGHYKCQTLCGGTVHWAVPVRVTFCYRDHISRSQQSQTNRIDYFTWLSWNIVGMLSTSSGSCTASFAQPTLVTSPLKDWLWDFNPVLQHFHQLFSRLYR